MKNKFSIAMTLAVILAMLVTSLALADTITPDADVITGGDQASYDLGNVAPGATLTPKASFKLVCAGNRHVDNGQLAVLSYTSSGSTVPAGGSLGASTATIGAIPVAWPDDGSTCPASPPSPIGDNGDSTVSIIAPSTPGTYTFIARFAVALSPAGANDPSSITGNVTVSYTLTVVGDTTPPIIGYTLTPSSPDGSNGWYKSNVSLIWSVTDPESTVTKTGCVDQSITADQPATNYSCSASSAGGSAGPVTVSIKRDATAPSISGAATPAPNGAGWNKTDVNVNFTCSDGTSGVYSCGPNQTLTNNGADQSASGTAVDNAGNSASAAVSNIDIDKELPTINASVPAANGNGWYNGSVTATFSCSDGYSGIDFCESPYIFSGEGSGLSYAGNASDVADNENSTNVSVNIDATAPVIALVSRTPANGNGWNNTDVALEWSCTDDGSGVVAATINKTVSAEGAGQSESATCQDLAGNTDSDTQTDINIDKTVPSISAGRTPAANANGWNNTNVTASYTASDGLSGLASAATGSFDFTSEGAGQSHTFTVTDLAGNSASATVSDVNIDKTAPSILAQRDTPANANGWNNTDVASSYTASDALSGLDSPASGSFNFTLEGAGQSHTFTVSDKAGNSASASVNDINIDKTAPSASASASPAANGNGWNNTNVTVSFSGADGLSGIDSCDAPVVLSSEGAGQSASGYCYDKAGNQSNKAEATGIKIDMTKPTISAAVSAGTLGLNGWYVTDVTVHFTCADTLSGAVGCPVDQLLNTEGLGVSSTAQTVMDAAGNTSDLSNVVTVNIDKTAPSLAWVGGPADGGNYDFGFVPAAPTCTASDATSGPNGCTVTGYGTSFGSHTMTATAYDLAGNSKIETRTYHVESWVLKGFYQPVDMNNVYNTVKSGSTVPLKFEVFTKLSGVEITDVTFVNLLTYAQVSCSQTAAEDLIETTATGGTVLRYDTTGGQFIFNWKTPGSAAGKCYRVTMTTLDGSKLEAFFKLK